MKKILCFVIMCFIVSVGFSEDFGAKIRSIHSKVIIDSDLKVNQETVIGAFNDRSVNASYVYVFLSDLPKDLLILDEQEQEVNYTSFVANDIYTIRILDEIEPNNLKYYTISYSNNQLVQWIDNNYYLFSYSFTSYYVLNEYSFELVLPRGFGITQKDVNTVSPPSSRIFSDGQQIILEWNEVLEYLENTNYLVFFERIAFSNFSARRIKPCGNDMEISEIQNSKNQ